MNTLNEREIRRLLSEQDPVEAPPELAERIKAEIPEDLQLPKTPLPFEKPSRMRASRRWLPLAASLLTLVGGAYMAVRWMPIAPESAAPRPAQEPLGTFSNPAETDTPSDDGLTESRSTESYGEARREGTVSPPLDPSSYTQPLPDTSVVPGPGARVNRPLGEATVESAAPRATAEPTPSIASQPASPTVPEPEPPSRRRLASERRDRAVVVTEEAQAEAMEFDVEDAITIRPPPPPYKLLPKPMFKPTAPTQQAEPFPSHKRLEEASMDRRSPMRPPTAMEPQPAPPPMGLAPASMGSMEAPNDAPFSDVYFQGYGTNPFIDTEDDALSTFGLDVDTASYTVVRRFLSQGVLPPPDAVRVEEMVNFFDYGDRPPKDEDFALYTEGAPSPFGQGERYHLLRFHLRGRDVAAENRPSALLTFVVDVSGSMDEENRLGLVKNALGLLLDQLRPDDRVALVVYGSQGRVLLEPTNDREAIRTAIRHLQPEGSTNAEEGLRLAYDLTARHLRPGAIHRLILCSDGVANVGRTGAQSILGQIQQHAQQGIELTTVGFGMGNYNDVLMEQLANLGNGRYAYVDSLEEAHRIFVEDLTGTLMTLAAEARTQVEFNPEVVSRYRLLGYENRAIADHRFRDDTVDAGEVGAGHAVTALYEVKLAEGVRLRRNTWVATLRLRYGSIAQGEMVELERRAEGRNFVRSWSKASPNLRLTALVAEFAEILKHTYWSRDSSLDDVFLWAQQVSVEFPGDHKVAEFVSLVGRAARLKERR